MQTNTLPFPSLSLSLLSSRLSLLQCAAICANKERFPQLQSLSQLPIFSKMTTCAHCVVVVPLLLLLSCCCCSCCCCADASCVSRSSLRMHRLILSPGTFFMLPSQQHVCQCVRVCVCISVCLSSSPIGLSICPVFFLRNCTSRVVAIS